MPTPAQLSRLLDLPLAARQRLAEQEGAGWWTPPDATVARWVPHPSPRCLGYEGTDASSHRLASGWAWLPADSAAFMRAATPAGGWWAARVGERESSWCIYRGPTGAPDDDGDILADAPTALDCALTALERTYGGTDA